MKRFFLLTIIILLSVLTSYGQKNVMLILGSATLETLNNRVKVASRLYHTQKIDKIIVSGGCGAHASSICEASEMKNQLTANGMPEHIIYKEENSKTTVQNYIFSRVLKDEHGEQIIKKHDSVFVVSDHWHAIAVAARFNKYDTVHAKFFIEGDIVPKTTDMLDYDGIFNKVADNNIFILKGTWPTPDAVFRDNGFTNYFFADRIYTIYSNKFSETTVNSLSTLEATLPIHWSKVDAVAKDDSKKQLMLFNNFECQISSLGDKSKSTSTLFDLNEVIIDLPIDIKNVDACFLKQSDLYLFTRNKVIVATKTADRFKVSKIKEIKSWMSNWPYDWGSGDLAAADYDEQDNVIFLYKNREVLKIDQKNNSVVTREKLLLKWGDIQEPAKKGK